MSASILALLLLQSAPAAPATPAVEILRPLENAVLQRRASDTASVQVDGLCPDGAGPLVAIARRGDLEVRERTRVLPLDGPRERFHARLELPAGAGYRLTVEREGSDEPLATVERFGVGDVFVIAGQSNSANWGEERFPALDERVLAFDGDRWVPAADPLPGVQDGSAGGSPWPLFGHLVAQATSLPVGLSSVGFGGSSLRHWQKNHEWIVGDRRVRLYDGLRARIDALGDARAILWHQGESDASGKMAQAEYVALFGALREWIVRDTGLEAPWVVARASYLPGLDAEPMDAIRAAQAELWQRGLAVRGPDTDDLLGPLRHSRDHVHFSKAGLEAHAVRWFARVWTGVLAR